MPVPYLITTLLFVFVALLAAADASLVSLNLISPFAALRWVRVHFVTLGIVSQLLFGLLPGLAATLSKKPRPAMRWETWIALNAGIVLLVVGFAGVLQPLILAGGTLVFTAAVLLSIQLWKVRGGDTSPSLKFYITGVGYLLVGIIVGTGLWLNWSKALYIDNPLETHIHANMWGFMSLAFAGLLVDLVTMITGRQARNTRALSLVYGSMTLGALGLVLGPWLGIRVPLIGIGLALLLIGASYLFVLVIRAFKASGRLSSPGAWHVISSYLWIYGPMLATPLIPLGVLEPGPVEATAPQALVYGWVLQFGIALAPYAARKFILKEAGPDLGGSWASLALVNIGNLLVWASIVVEPVRGLLHGTGFAFYALALIQPLRELLKIAQMGINKIEAE